jgi:hypothetical protein
MSAIDVGRIIGSYQNRNSRKENDNTFSKKVPSLIGVNVPTPTSKQHRHALSIRKATNGEFVKSHSKQHHHHREESERSKKNRTTIL